MVSDCWMPDFPAKRCRRLTKRRTSSTKAPDPPVCAVKSTIEETEETSFASMPSCRVLYHSHLRCLDTDSLYSRR